MHVRQNMCSLSPGALNVNEVLGTPIGRTLPPGLCPSNFSRLNEPAQSTGIFHFGRQEGSQRLLCPLCAVLCFLAFLDRHIVISMSSAKSFLQTNCNSYMTVRHQVSAQETNHKIKMTNRLLLERRGNTAATWWNSPPLKGTPWISLPKSVHQDVQNLSLSMLWALQLKRERTC